MTATLELSEPPVVGDIRSIPDGPDRFGHVCKHLYGATERWQQVAPGLPERAKERARRAGCTDRLMRGRGDYWSAPEGCLSCVTRDHDQHYEPAYRAALASSIEAGTWGRDRKHERRGEIFVGARGVIVIVNLVQGQRQVSSAYRDVPKKLPPDKRTPEAFHKKAMRRLRDRTGLKGADS